MDADARPALARPEVQRVSTWYIVFWQGRHAQWLPGCGLAGHGCDYQLKRTTCTAATMLKESDLKTLHLLGAAQWIHDGRRQRCPSDASMPTGLLGAHRRTRVASRSTTCDLVPAILAGPRQHAGTRLAPP